MSSVFLIGTAVVAFAVNGICTRAFQLHCQKTARDISLYQSLFCLAAGVCFLLMEGNIRGIDLPVLLFGTAFGLFFFLMILFSAKGYESGPMSLTGIITNMSMIIPLAYSCAVYRESVTPLQVVGVVLMTATIVLAGIGPDGGAGRVSRRWLLTVMLAFLTNGVIAVVQKQYCISYPHGRQSLFMAVAYFTSAVLFCLYYFFQKAPRQKAGTAVPLPPLLILSLLSGVGSFGGNGISTYLSSRVNASILYPCVNGGLCIALAAASFLIFREKISPMKIVSIFIGLAAITILNL